MRQKNRVKKFFPRMRQVSRAWVMPTRKQAKSIVDEIFGRIISDPKIGNDFLERHGQNIRRNSEEVNLTFDIRDFLAFVREKGLSQCSTLATDIAMDAILIDKSEQNASPYKQVHRVTDRIISDITAFQTEKIKNENPQFKKDRQIADVSDLIKLLGKPRGLLFFKRYQSLLKLFDKFTPTAVSIKDGKLSLINRK